MSVEPGIVDANVLVYALDADPSQHLASRRLLDEGNAPPPFGLRHPDKWDNMSKMHYAIGATR